MEQLKRIWSEERTQVPLWTPVLIGLGVQIYFWLSVEPSYWASSVAVATPLLVFTVLWRKIARYWLIGFAAILIAIGFSAAGLRSNIVAAPVMTAPLDATIEGRIAEITRSTVGRLVSCWKMLLSSG